MCFRFAGEIQSDIPAGCWERIPHLLPTSVWEKARTYRWDKLSNKMWFMYSRFSRMIQIHYMTIYYIYPGWARLLITSMGLMQKLQLIRYYLLYVSISVISILPVSCRGSAAKPRPQTVCVGVPGGHCGGQHGRRRRAAPHWCKPTLVLLIQAFLLCRCAARMFRYASSLHFACVQRKPLMCWASLMMRRWACTSWLEA